MIWLMVGAMLAGASVSSLRWLRVAQREHYLPPAVSRFAWRWWNTGTANQLLGLAALGGVVASFFLSPSWAWLGLLAAVGPLGLGLRGRTSALAWTPRLRRVAIVTGVFEVLLAAWSVTIGTAGPAAAGVVALPRLVDAATAILAGYERRQGDQWVQKAKDRLSGSGATVVAITGSYGKTTTKTYLAHLLRGQRSTVVTPASFNNRMGLARAINEQLVPGTEVFVAEMGTYGAGEIRQLCEFVPPRVAVITAIGPVHLERFGTEEKIVAAKSEILERAEVAVIAVDHPLLRRLATDSISSLRVITVSVADPGADVAVIDCTVLVAGQSIGAIGPEAFGSNVGCAVGAALALGVEPEALGRKLSDLPVAAHRRQTSKSESGVTIIDDTYNSNPAGARAALRSLLEVLEGGRRVVVTPGMVELGSAQYDENREWASDAADQATDLVVVGRTNRTALEDGAKGRRAHVRFVSSRSEAVEWVRENLVAGDAVLYENDLPDHYP